MLLRGQQQRCVGAAAGRSPEELARLVVGDATLLLTVPSTTTRLLEYLVRALFVKKLPLPQV